MIGCTPFSGARWRTERRAPHMNAALKVASHYSYLKHCFHLVVSDCLLLVFSSVRLSTKSHIWHALQLIHSREWQTGLLIIFLSQELQSVCISLKDMLTRAYRWLSKPKVLLQNATRISLSRIFLVSRSLPFQTRPFLPDPQTLRKLGCCLHLITGFLRGCLITLASTDKAYLFWF